MYNTSIIKLARDIICLGIMAVGAVAFAFAL
jgi:hypothetical protein